jgi:methylmalonyl-CoA/ethylmalonyl-CoA epimerase
MKKLEHIGIAVKSLRVSIPIFEELLGLECYKTESVENEKVNTAFFKKGETKIELLESTAEDGPIGKFIEKKGEGIHHIAFEVEDLQTEIERLKNEGFTFVCFLHPKSCNGVLVELCQQVK